MKTYRRHIQVMQMQESCRLCLSLDACDGWPVILSFTFLDIFFKKSFSELKICYLLNYLLYIFYKLNFLFFSKPFLWKNNTFNVICHFSFMKLSFEFIYLYNNLLCMLSTEYTFRCMVDLKYIMKF